MGSGAADGFGDGLLQDDRMDKMNNKNVLENFMMLVFVLWMVGYFSFYILMTLFLSHSCEPRVLQVGNTRATLVVRTFLTCRTL